MFEGQHGVMLREHNWSSWPEFRHLVHDMDVCLQPSYTESFNMVTADAIAECVPSVVSDVIDWAPPAWVAQVDSAVDIADKALLILYDNRAWHTGQEALRRYVRDGVEQWKKFLLRVR